MQLLMDLTRKTALGLGLLLMQILDLMKVRRTELSNAAMKSS